MTQTNLNLSPLTIAPEDAAKIAQKLIDGEVCKQKLSNTQNAYQSCIDDHHPNTPFFARPEVEIVGGVVLTFVGFMFGITRCLGACR